MEEIVGGIFHFLLRAIGWILIELLFHMVCWGTGWVTLKLITFGKYPNRNTHEDTVSFFGVAVLILLLIAVTMHFHFKS